MSEQDWEPSLTVLSLCGEHCAVGPSTLLTSWMLAVKVPEVSPAELYVLGYGKHLYDGLYDERQLEKMCPAGRAAHV